VKELQDNGVEYSKMGERMLMIKSEVVGRPRAVSDDFVQIAVGKNL
jgi:hypothetical protein